MEAASPLGGRRAPLAAPVLVSLAAHAAVLGYAFLHRPPPIVDLDQKPIVAKLVRLGEQRPNQRNYAADHARAVRCPEPTPPPSKPCSPSGS